ncbi:MAG: hypothetical protein K1X64_15115 [Myxococcaceae bacterium]|nr:hypothetical protein [Myxococcaceae bacterium]
MTSPEAAWRALVEKELGGSPFDKALVQPVLDGVAVAPLYTSVPAKAFRELRSHDGPWVCMRYSSATAEEDVRSGADALWLPAEALDKAPKTRWVVDPSAAGLAVAEAERAAAFDGAVFAFDPLGTDAMAELPRVARVLGDGRPAIVVSTVAYHDAGADAADELACALSTFALYLRELDDPSSVSFRLAVGRETFIELCKLRALRTCHARLLAAAGVKTPGRALVHAVCSSRTLTQRDPWVNMLRVTTQAFAAMAGGADFFTPAAFDQELEQPSALGRRVARNTALVLRDESGLGRVTDPAGGSYTFETLTDALAREAWKRFQVMERTGGIAQSLARKELQARLATAAAERADKVVKRKLPVLGVSDFANLDEVLPRTPRASSAAVAGAAFPLRRDAEPLEALRTRVEAAKPALVVLLTLGTFAQSRPRAGFAQGFFAAAGLRTREVATPEKAAVVCLCGSDERYVAEAAARVAELKALGCRRVLLAGRPGALDAALREAGLDGALFLGADVVATLSPLLEVLS